MLGPTDDPHQNAPRPNTTTTNLATASERPARNAPPPPSQHGATSSRTTAHAGDSDGGDRDGGDRDDPDTVTAPSSVYRRNKDWPPEARLVINPRGHSGLRLQDQHSRLQKTIKASFKVACAEVLLEDAWPDNHSANYIQRILLTGINTVTGDTTAIENRILEDLDFARSMFRFVCHPIFYSFCSPPLDSSAPVLGVPTCQP